MLPWTFFANAMSLAANSLVGSSHLIIKVDFPRILIPVAAIASGLVDFAISFVVMLLMMAAYHVAPSWPMLLLPLYLIGTIVSAAGAGILFEYPTLRVALLLAICVWCFARFYYFAFYVIEHYIDSEYRFAGLGSFALYLLRRWRGTLPPRAQ
jgi:lipopolysaccharide transport system permease protein